MLNKSVMALAVLMACAGMASAAQVTLYGRVDMGMSYTHQKTTLDPVSIVPDRPIRSVMNRAAGPNLQLQPGPNRPPRPPRPNRPWDPTDPDAPAIAGSYTTNQFSMDSGNSTGSRWGIKGSESISDDLTVKFVLESGFDADTGKFSDSDRLFNREATLSLVTPYGTFAAGRMGSILSDAGSYGFYSGLVSPFGTGWNQIAGHNGVMAMGPSRYDNALVYQSPDMDGLTLYAQYAMGKNGRENKSGSDRYMAVGGSYSAGPLTIASVFDYTRKASLVHYNLPGGILPPPIAGQFNPLPANPKDAMTFNVGGSWDADFAKFYVATQYFKNAGNPADVLGMVADRGFDLADSVAVNMTGMGIMDLGGHGPAGGPIGIISAMQPLSQYVGPLQSFISSDGWGLNLGASIPLGNGELLLSTGYMDAKLKAAGYDPIINLVADDPDEVPEIKEDIGRFTDNIKPKVQAFAFSVGYTYDLSKRTSVYAGAGYYQRRIKLNAHIDDVVSINGRVKDEVAQAVFGLVHKF